MFTTKKAQYMPPQESNHPLWSLFIAMILIFTVVVIYLVMTRPFQIVDDKLSPKINLTTDNNDAQEVLNKIRLYWVVWPVIIITSIIFWAVLMSLKQDPNYPNL